MDINDNFIVVHPTQNVNNNLKRKTRDNLPTYNKVLEDRLNEEKIKMEQLQSRINNLEKRLQQIEKSKIVTAPLKEDISIDEALRRRQMITLNGRPTTSQMAQSYTRAKQAYLRAVVQADTLPIAKKEEKLTFWQKIKKAIKNFIGEDSQEKDSQKQNNSNSYNKNNDFKNDLKYNINNNVINVNNRNITDSREIGKNFDRYA